MRILAAFSFVVLLATSANAQGLGYAAAGPAGVSGFFGDMLGSFHAGGGGEVVVDDRLGFGGEIGFFDRFVTAAGNVTVHLAGVSNASLSPFVTGGVSWFGIGDGEFKAVNVGAGLHYWASKHAGLRLEFRDHFRPDHRGTTQYWSARVGVVFR